MAAPPVPAHALASISARTRAASRTSNVRRSSVSVWRSWVLANVVGEIIGFGAAAGAGAAVALALDRVQGVYAFAIGSLGVVLLGVIEGSAVGQAQWLVLRSVLSGAITQRAWLIATLAGAILAWGAGMAAGTAVGETSGLRDNAIVTAVGAIGIGVVAGALLSTAQWLVLRRVVASAGWWIPTHAAAWAIGMLVAFTGMSFIGPDTPFALAALLGAGTGLFMGGVVASITGAAVVCLCRRACNAP
jgi:hypothetical protein